MQLAPIVVFAYNRCDRLKTCIEALERNEEFSESQVYIFSDGAKSRDSSSSVNMVRDFLQEYKNNTKAKELIIYRNQSNKGLANSIIEGVSQIIEKHGKIIVIEDDLVVSNKFLRFMNTSLDYYEKKVEIGAISGYTYPLKELNSYNEDIYFLWKGDCWGWGTWKDRWNRATWANVNYVEYRKKILKRIKFGKLEANWDLLMLQQEKGIINSWAIRWVYYLYLQKLLTVYPRISFVNNEGFDGNGTHCNNQQIFKTIIDEESHDIKLLSEAVVNRKIARAASRYPRGKLLGYFWCVLVEKIKLSFRKCK